jgi:hypothetical protein
LDNNGQTSILARDGYDVNDPEQTFARANRAARNDVVQPPGAAVWPAPLSQINALPIKR